MDDNVLIAKEELSKKEIFLKDRLYAQNKAPKEQEANKNLGRKNADSNGIPSNFGVENNLPVENFKHSGNMFPVDKTNSSEVLYKMRTNNVAPQSQAGNKKQPINQTDEKMHSFLDEMRQQFLQTQNVNVIPQSLMYRQTQLMERQVQMLEANQKQMGEVVNNIMNQPQTGASSGAGVKQNVFNENRKMMLEMMVPVNQQLNDMKLLYENTKTCSTDLEKKIDELKRVMSMQAGALQTGQSYGGGGFGGNTAAMFQDNGVLDPTLLQKGISVIKEQMKDVQKEALQIETEMERRFSDMLNRNTQRRYLPKSLTDELVEHKMKLHETGSGQSVDMPNVGYAQIREVITERLGGPFDYAQLSGDFKQIQSEMELLKNEFKHQALYQPEFKNRDQIRISEFDFTLPVVSVDSHQGVVNGSSQSDKVKISYQKPQNLAQIQTTATYIIDCDPRELEQAAKLLPKPKVQVEQYQPEIIKIDSQREEIKIPEPSLNQNRMVIQQSKPGEVKPSMVGGSQKLLDKNVATVNQKESQKGTDLFTLKKQVIEEIKSEMQLVGNNKKLNIGYNHTNYIDPFSRLEAQNAEQINLKGVKRNLVDDDEDLIIVNSRIAKAHIDSHQSSLRGSTVHNQSLTESQILNTIADVVFQEINGNNDQHNQSYSSAADLSGSLNQSFKQRIGEEMVIEKINRIFEQVAQENQDNSKKQNLTAENIAKHHAGKLDISSSSVFINQSNSAQQQTQLRPENPPIPVSNVPQPMPYIMPIIINDNGNIRNNNSYGGQSDHFMNEIRDAINQAVQQQLQLQSVRLEHNLPHTSSAQLRAQSHIEEEERQMQLESKLLQQMIPIDARELLKHETRYTNPFLTGQRSKIEPPIIVDISESEDSYYQGNYSPLNRSDGEIGGDQYMQALNEKRPQPGMIKPVAKQTNNNNLLAQSRGYTANVPTEGIKEPIRDSGEGPVVHNSKGVRTGGQVYQSAESFGGQDRGKAGLANNSKFNTRQQIQENFLEDNDDSFDESGEIDPNLLF